MERFKERYARVMQQARHDAGLSQKEAANLMNVSRSTVQKWEDGSVPPSFEKLLDYLDKLQRPAVPYVLYLCDPAHYKEATIESSRAVLHELIDTMDDETIKKLFFCAFANHGSDSFAVLEMVVAHLQSPLRARLNVAHDIMMNYQIASHHEDVSRGSNTHPNIEFLNKAINNCVDAVVHDKQSYKAIK